jgi:AbrB family looped-hinge helix DNA binding protein
MSSITIKIGTAGRGQIPHDVREKLNIQVGDTLIVEIREVLKSTQSIENDQNQEVPA